MKKVLITGVAGFIGYHLANMLLNSGFDVYGLDNLQDSGEPHLKHGRLSALGIDAGHLVYGKIVSNREFHFMYADINDLPCSDTLFESVSFDVVIHLAAQTGVRNSLINPDIYIRNNIQGFQNIILSCRKHGVNKLVFASSSSVYGNNPDMPYKEDIPTDSPVSLYAVTKKTNELMAQFYATMYGMQCIGLRFFTVYGPWARTDMASYIFMKAISDGRPINLFNNGLSLRDFTYVDDVVKSIKLIIEKMLDKSHSSMPAYDIFNVGNSCPVNLEKFLNCIENSLGQKAVINNKPIQEGDVNATYACVDKLVKFIGFKPETPIEAGVDKMVNWFNNFK